MSGTAASVAFELTPHLQYLLRWADTALIHAQRLTEWCGHGPVLEEDIAFSNMGLDLLGQARGLLSRVAALHGHGATEDTLAFLREEHQFFNATLAEQPSRKGSAHAPPADFADMVLRGFVLATWFKGGWAGLQGSSDAQVAGIAAKALKEARYHQQHLGDWVVRLGDSTPVARQRIEAAMARAWPYCGELFVDDAVDAAAAASGLGPTRSSLLARWDSEVDAVLAEATLARPAPSLFKATGLQGVHSEHLGYILAEMQYLQRRYPGGRW